MAIVRLPEDSGVVVSTPLPELSGGSWFEPPVVIQAALAPHNTVQIGAFTGIYGGKVGHCRIGRYCSVAPGVDIASDQHPTTWLSSSMLQYVPNLHGWGDWLRRHGYEYHGPTSHFASNAPVEIGNDVWIGQGVFIRSGVRIGDGAVIAAHSVVVQDVPAYGVVAGVPARLKKFRFTDRIIERLAELQWWRYNITGLVGLNFSDVERAIERIGVLAEEGKLVEYNPEKFVAS